MSAALEQYRARLFGLGYRITGSASDAEEIVQEAFLRAMEHAPEKRDGLEGWLTTVASRLAIDRLRARKRTTYLGNWLPEPIANAQRGMHARLENLDTLRYSFLNALEALSENARAVFVLRDIYELSTRETAEILELSESNIKVLLHRARKEVKRPESDEIERDRRDGAAILMRFLLALQGGDLSTVRALLTDDAIAHSDGGGKYFAARKPVIGAEKVANFWLRTTPAPHEVREAKPVFVNGLAGVFFRFAREKENAAPAALFLVELGETGAVRRIYSVLADEKLRSFERAF